MFCSTMLFFSRRLLAFISLALFCSLASGCATRVLMSSDRYEKPQQEITELRSSDEISRSWHPHQNLQQAYLNVINAPARLKHGI